MAKFYFKWPTEFWKSIHKSFLLCMATMEIDAQVLCCKRAANIYQLFPCVLHCSIDALLPLYSFYINSDFVAFLI